MSQRRSNIGRRNSNSNDNNSHSHNIDNNNLNNNHNHLKELNNNNIKDPLLRNDTTTTTTNKQQQNKQEYENPSGNIKLLSIPRTTRWRLQLGLLGIPTESSQQQQQQQSNNDSGNTILEEDNDDDDVVVSASTKTNKLNDKDNKKNNNSTTKENKKKGHTNASASASSNDTNKSTNSKRSVSFEDIERFEYNIRMIKEQRLRFDLLTKRHMWSGSLLDILGSDNNDNNDDTNTTPTIITTEESTDNDNDNTTIEKTKAEDDKEEEKNNRKSIEGLDPLSAILMEQEQQKEQPRAKTTIQTLKESTSSNESSISNWSMFYSSRELITMIQKDLDRLPPFHHQITLKTQVNDIKDFNISFSLSEDNDNNDNDQSQSTQKDNDKKRQQERKSIILQILFMYAKEYPDIGYRQGMHEILSFILLAIELDYETQLSKNRQSILLYIKNNILHDTYTLFEMIMYHLSPSYDTCILKRPPHCTPTIARRARPSSSPMQAMGLSILAKVRRSGGESLYKLLSYTINVPPQLYCTRWVRLMLCREFNSVAGVLLVWDAFFSLISPHPHSSTLMNVLEYAAAVMILLQKDQLLKNYTNNEHHHHGYDDGESIQLLMNYPPMQNYDLFLSQLRYMVFTTLGVTNKHTKKIQLLQQSQNTSVEQTIDQVSTIASKSWSKAFQSLGGSYHNIVHNVEKTYKAAITKHATTTNHNNESTKNNSIRSSAITYSANVLLNDDDDKNLHSTMSLQDVEKTLDDSIMIFKTFIRRVSDELSSNNNSNNNDKNINNTNDNVVIPMQQDVIEAITKLQKVKLNIRNFYEQHQECNNNENMNYNNDNENNNVLKNDNDLSSSNDVAATSTATAVVGNNSNAISDDNSFGGDSSSDSFTYDTLLEKN